MRRYLENIEPYIPELHSKVFPQCYLESESEQDSPNTNPMVMILKGTFPSKDTLVLQIVIQVLS